MFSYRSEEEQQEVKGEGVGGGSGVTGVWLVVILQVDSRRCL